MKSKKASPNGSSAKYVGIKSVGKQGRKWLTFRRNFLKKRANWYGAWECEHCHKECLYVEVDHIKKRSTNPELKYEETNLAILCRNCHRIATSNKP